MRVAHEMTATLKVGIPNRALTQTLLAQWSELPGVSMTIVRGRVTCGESRFELEIRGSAANVARIVRQSAPWDAARRFLNPATADASA